MTYLLGLDIGSSSVKAALVDGHSGHTLALAQSPATEMEIVSPQPGWAEQDPELWWLHSCQAIRLLLSSQNIDAQQIAAVGIAYQMHGLVLLDQNGELVRPAIIWCDSRAVAIGEKAYQELGKDYCMGHYLNSPGNFTASKLKWVQENEPAAYARIHKVMLPGDYIAYKLTGEMTTTVSGLSEGTLWDFKLNKPAKGLMDYYGCDTALLSDITETFGIQGRVQEGAAKISGIPAGVPVTYRAGDQPNNALSLNVLSPGEVAATGGTSGVVYGISAQLSADPENRVNSFAHVNHRAQDPRIGILLCINGAGITYSWMRRQLADSQTPYDALEALAKSVPVGSDGLTLFPFGNGAERMLGNRMPGASLLHLDFNRHQKEHLLRAALEGIAFSFVYGIQQMQEIGLNIQKIRVGNDNLFQSAVFSNTVSSLTGASIDMLKSNGATGAAIASGVGIGLWRKVEDGLSQLAHVRQFTPAHDTAAYQEAFQRWKQGLAASLKGA
jgi:xylulokinase